MDFLIINLVFGSSPLPLEQSYNGFRVLYDQIPMHFQSCRLFKIQSY